MPVGGFTSISPNGELKNLSPLPIPKVQYQWGSSEGEPSIAELPGHGLQIPVLRVAPCTPYPSPTFFVEVPRRAVAVGSWEDAPPASPSGRSARSLRYAIAGRAVAGCRRCRCRAGGAPCPPGTRGRQVAIWQAAAHGAGRGGLARRTLALRAVRQSDSSCCARSDTNRLKRYVPRSGCRRGAR